MVFNPYHYSDTVVYFIYVIFILYLICSVFCNYLFLSYSKNSIISARRPYLVLFTSLFAINYVVFLFIVTLYTQNCILSYLGQHVFVFAVVFGYLLRTFTLYCSFRRQHDLNAGEISVYVKYNVDKPLYLAVYFCIGTFINVVVALIMMLIDPDLANTSDCVSLNFYSSIFVLVQVIICCSIIIFLAYLSRNYEDALKVKTELRIVGYFSIFAAIIWYLIRALPPIHEFNNSTFPVRYSWLLFIMFFILLISTFYPVYHAKKLRVEYSSLNDEQKAVEINSNEKLTFSTVISDDVLSKNFREYLLKEFAIENLLFIQAVDILVKNISDPNSRNDISYHQQANSILNNYIFDDSPMQINISEAISSKLISDLSSIDNLDDDAFAKQIFERKIFIDAYRAIEFILESGSLIRWLQSDDYKNVFDKPVSIEISNL